jgi:hypothetical protein
VVSHHTVARETAEAGLMRLIAALAVIMPAIALILMVANMRDYRQPAVVLGVWLGVLGSGAWLVPRLRRGGLRAGETVAAIAIAVAAVAVIGAVRRPDTASASVDLAVLGTSWLLVLVVMSHSARVWFPGAVLVLAAHTATIIRDAGVNPLTLSQLEAGGYILANVLIAFAAFRPTLATRADMIARQAALASKSAAERAGVAAIQQERHDRLAVLESEALPLLRGIADGTLDPGSGLVQQQCARHAAILRESLTGWAPQAGQLAVALKPVLRAAREHGLLVTEQLIGDPGRPPAVATRAVLAMLDVVLSELPAQQVVFTVLASVDDVEIYLTFDAPLRSLPDLARLQPDLPASAQWHAALVATETGGGCLELRWRKDKGP